MRKCCCGGEARQQPKWKEQHQLQLLGQQLAAQRLPQHLNRQSARLTSRALAPDLDPGLLVVG